MFFDAQGNLLTRNTLSNMIAQGQGFVYSTGQNTSPATAENLGLSVFNPSNSGKNILIYSIKMVYTGYGFFTLAPVAADPALGTAANIKNASLGSAIASVASASYTNVNIAAPPANNTILEAVQSPGNMTVAEMLGNGAGEQAYLLTKGIGTGLMLFFNSSAANAWCMTMKGIEF